MGATWLVRLIVTGVVVYVLGQAIRTEYVELAGRLQQTRPAWVR